MIGSMSDLQRRGSLSIVKFEASVLVLSKLVITDLNLFDMLFSPKLRRFFSGFYGFPLCQNNKQIKKKKTCICEFESSRIFECSQVCLKDTWSHNLLSSFKAYSITLFMGNI